MHSLPCVRLSALPLVSHIRSPGRSVKARQQVFFALRRQNAATAVAAPGRDDRKLLAASRQDIKQIRSSFDIFALEGKEEYIGMHAWLDEGHGSQACTAVASQPSLPLATYDGESRLAVADRSTPLPDAPCHSGPRFPRAANDASGGALSCDTW